MRFKFVNIFFVILFVFDDYVRTEFGKLWFKQQQDPAISARFRIDSRVAAPISFRVFLKAWLFFAPVALYQAIVGIIRFLFNMEKIHREILPLPDCDLSQLCADLILNTYFTNLKHFSTEANCCCMLLILMY